MLKKEKSRKNQDKSRNFVGAEKEANEKVS